ncbi:MAG TPA: TetR/AcrR family transcriptional regulator [Solirubrobacteraceae bacterium]|nr:TetR/AcrR family transcriptional regulator [Solirubrobacteraceae bacterium]
MSTHPRPARREQLLESAYGYVLQHGLTDLSLRPLAKAIGSSPRVLLYLFDSKDGLVHALLARARQDERRLLDELGAARPLDLCTVARSIWEWLAARERRGLLVLWAESYARSLSDPRGPWGGFARATVDDWLALLARAQPPEVRDTPDGQAERTLVLAVLRGALLDLLATGDRPRADAAVGCALRAVAATG